LDTVPRGIDPDLVRSYLAGLSGVAAVHDLHIWGLSTTETALTAHLVRPDARIDDDWLHEVTHQLHERFGIVHATIQVESGQGQPAFLGVFVGHWHSAADRGDLVHAVRTFRLMPP